MTTTTTTLTLYQYEACPFCWKVKAALAYKGIDYTTVEVHPLNKKEIAFSKEYRKVPILIAGDKQINDSTEILRFLDSEFPDKPLFEHSEHSSAEQEWLTWVDGPLVQALPPVIYQTFGKSFQAFGYITKVGQFSWLQKRLIRLSGAAVMTIIAKKGAKRRGIGDPIANFKQCLKQWEQAIGSEGFFGESHPNAADITAYGYLRAIQNLPAFGYVRENSRVYDWFKELAHTLDL